MTVEKWGAGRWLRSSHVEKTWGAVRSHPSQGNRGSAISQSLQGGFRAPEMVFGLAEVIQPCFCIQLLWREPHLVPTVKELPPDLWAPGQDCLERLASPGFLLWPGLNTMGHLLILWPLAFSPLTLAKQ